jgi:CheY-like chemotaxis protein/tetratricopeptide (TPR) repeat protein
MEGSLVVAGRNVLCVDDDRNLCQILSEAIRSEGYRVRSAFDGDQALMSLVEDPPDLVLIDQILPRRNGFEVLEAIRALDTPLCDTPVVMVSGCSPTPESRERSARLGVMEILTKPIPLDDLLAVVARCTGESKQEREEQDVGGAARIRATTGLSGSLATVPIAALIHHLHGLRATGVLHLTNGRKRKWIEIHDGYPRAVRSNLVNECLGNFLVREGKLSKASLEESRRRMKPGRLQGEILVAMDLLSEDEVVAALSAQADEKLFEVFAWTSGSYKFEKGAGLECANAFGLVESPANLIVRGLRARFPLEAVESHLDQHADSFLAPGESPFYRFQDVDLSTDERELFESLDGRRKLSEFLGGDEVRLRTIYALLAVGLLELRRAKGRRVSPTPKRTIPVSSRPRVEDEEKHERLMGLADRLSNQSYFEILGVPPDSTPEAATVAFGGLAARMHPDQYSTASDSVKALAAEVFAMINRAHETLTTPKLRGEYSLKRQNDKRRAAKAEEDQRVFDSQKCFRFGEALLAQRSYERALQAFGKALELHAEEGDYHAHYGWALHLCHPGEPSMAEEAIEHIRRGIKLAGHREKSYLYLGRLYKAIGRVGTAEKMFTRAVQIKPDCVEALRELRLINMRRHKSKGFIGRLLRR